MSPDVPAALARVKRLLDLWSEPTAVIGGFAVVAHARARATRDIDLVITVPPGRASDLLVLARSCGFDYDPVETRMFLEAGLARLWAPPDRARGFGLDLLFADSAFTESVVARARPMDLGGVTLPVATPEDLILLKLEANRPIDIDDVLALKDACRATLDLPYLRDRAGELDLADRLALYLGDLLPE